MSDLLRAVRQTKRQFRRRNHVERFVSRTKHFRGVAKRYEKPARNFLGFIKFAALFSWLPNVNTIWSLLSCRPRSFSGNRVPRWEVDFDTVRRGIKT